MSNLPYFAYIEIVPIVIHPDEVKQYEVAHGLGKEKKIGGENISREVSKCEN